MTEKLTFVSEVIGDSRISFGDFEAIGLVSFLVVTLSALIAYRLAKPIIQKSGKAVLKTLLGLAQEE